MRKIRIEHLARVEGHGAITVEVDGKKVKKVKMEILEGPRLFETLSIGKLPSENLNLVPRICAICTLSHRYASLRATEKCLGIKVQKKVWLLRELMLHGEMIESHALHVYLLALPDLLGYPNAVTMVDKYGDYVKEGLTLKKFGNSIMELISGRATHGENPIIGGFGKYPSIEQLLRMSEEAERLIPSTKRCIELLGGMKLPEFLDQNTNYVCVDPPGKRYGFSSDGIAISDGRKFDVEDYDEVTNEEVVAHSYAKRSSYDGKPYTVGALARINNLGERLKGDTGKYFRKYRTARWKKNPLYNNIAQALEILFVLESIPEMVEDIISLKDPKIVQPKRRSGKGTGAVEAPRGILFHSYEIKNGRMKSSNIITPTAQNLDDIERYLRRAAGHMLQKGKTDKAIIQQLETVARAYDPCISCSAHLIKLERV